MEVCSLIHFPLLRSIVKFVEESVEVVHIHLYFAFLIDISLHLSVGSLFQMIPRQFYREISVYILLIYSELLFESLYRGSIQTDFMYHEPMLFLPFPRLPHMSYSLQ